ncbi:LEAF RUST 10 DISEASE-RESISTANCE LOCUS RECEPTOR-LIKE PROTEIN KINASE-like 1.2 isoform X1 [Phragmites australis]|uniref:LEAF RUST 10 DISEASE-RESISTANCE LOCUS RECEPTOR-LIKE PROTEIN KINASE-like 1.2 isoform X1 n=1 Tax=Phragmites australis TaxID=29695 RepID=UPI002D79E194|nr:LEAF RUST 10 DISEASE-RESISTANCE LOCUS RECEPTOR-LIKE PROTEIN KINASE-like 1.2 isoform X1 [Phragmites australis]
MPNLPRRLPGALETLQTQARADAKQETTCQPAASPSLTSLAMALLLRHRLPPPLPLLLVILVAASHGTPSSGDNYDPPMCLRQPQHCGNVNIRYPFYLYNETGVLLGKSSSYCGYPDLGIMCSEDDEQAILQLGGHNYTVSNINYTDLTVSVVDQEVRDQEACPRVDHNVSLPLGLSYAYNTVDYLFLFLNCSFNPAVAKSYNINPIRCEIFGGPTTGLSFVLWQSDVPLGDWWQACQQVFEAPVLKHDLPIPGVLEWTTGGYGSYLRGGFQLAWNQKPPECNQCEQSNGQCGYNQAGEFVGCLCSSSRAEPHTCSSGSKKRTRIIAGVLASAAGAVALSAAIFLFIRKSKQKKVINSSSKLLKYSGSGGTPRSRGGDMESGSIQDLQTHLFSYEELEAATDCFNDSRELGDGGFGTVYKGYLQDGRVVAVKRLYNNSYRRVEQFMNEAAILSELRHPNLVMFYGCTSSHSRELLLVYEFVANGTVADHLHGHRAPERALSWPLRLNIAVESAAALTYLHAIEPPVVHRDVKTTNILLDADFHVKVADFGLSRLFPLDVTHVSTAPQGTPGYVDPEYHQCYQLTDKSDVYSFGVVLVELISSKPAVDITRHRNEINLAGMAINKIQKCQLEQLVDLELGYETDPATKKMMTMVAELAFRCLQQNSEMRPPIKEVHEVLKGIQGECQMEKDGDKDRDLAGPFSPKTVHAPWDSRATTPNASQ